MKHIFSILSLLIGLAMLIGCGHKDPSHAEAEQGHDHVCGMAVTEWQDSLELFAEWPHFVAGESSEAVLHFTDLRTFEPATDGPLTVNWKRNNQVIKSDRADRVARTGIFLMSLTPPPSGSYDLEFVLAGRDMAGTVVVFDVTVYPN
ncbi:hypothetical protein KKH27_10675 [bacterium]|nr:hypothetical protein [bacterium]